jgi:hypothetical protein
MCKFLFLGCAAARIEKIDLHLSKELDKLGAVALVYADESFAPRELSNRCKLRQQRASLFPQVEKPAATILGVPTPLDPAALFEPIDDSNQRNSLNFENVCQAALLDPLVLSQVGHHLPLRAGKSERSRPLLETFSQQPRHVVQQKPERAVDEVG